MICERVLSRRTQGSLLADKQMVQEALADSWMELEQFRLFVMRTAWKIDRLNNYKQVREDIAASKILASRVLMNITTRAMHLHGSLGISNEMPFGDMLFRSFVMGVADGPDEVHKVTIARRLLSGRHETVKPFPKNHVPRKTLHAMQKYAEELELPGDRSPWIEYLRNLPKDALDDL
jgi:acyl-CoA dehydrogenase